MTGVRCEITRIRAFDGSMIDAIVSEPAGPGPHPAILMGGEAMGPNAFGREVARRLAEAGYVTVTPDYYRGLGPSKPDDYSDFTEVIAAIDALDFRRAAHDVMAGADWLRANPKVDPSRIAVWGYCTGGTLALLSACLDRKLSAAVLFFPSQPRFEALTDKRPVQPMDMIWNIACPVLTIYGDQDPIMPPELLSDWIARFARDGVPHDLKLYPGAGHAFSAPAPHMRDDNAADASWLAALDFVKRHVA